MSKMREDRMPQNFANLHASVNHGRTWLHFMAKVQEGWDSEIDEVDNTTQKFFKRGNGFEMHAS